jgi:hypothetical protein
MVNSEKEKSLQELMSQLGVREEDIEEKFIRSRRAKLKILEAKRLHSQKKSLRAAVRQNDY